MRSNTILRIFAFFATFALSVGVVWLLFGLPEIRKPLFFQSDTRCFSRQAKEISSLLLRDDNNGNERDQTILQMLDEGYYISGHADAVTDYIDASEAIDSDNLPQDFQDAWHKHLRAWRDYSDFLNETKISVKNGEKIENKNFSRENRLHSLEINTTWYEVLRIARNYGAEIPPQ